MNRPNHTEGPWHVKARYQDMKTFVVCDPEGWVLLESKMPGGSTDEQNARLAAAAPQLAEAIVDAAKHRAIIHWLKVDIVPSVTEARDYADRRWNIHLLDSERAALTAAGYLNNNENE